LSLSFGIPTLNAEPLWAADASRIRTVTAWNGLHRLEKEHGYRILVLTSTDAGATLIPGMNGKLTLLRDFGPLRYTEIAHRKRPRGFPLRSRHHHFRLYCWTGESRNIQREHPLQHNVETKVAK